MGLSRVARQVQQEIPAATATFKPIGHFNYGDAVNYGHTFCPFCSKPTEVGGPKSGRGLAFIYNTCRHSQGIAADNGFGITVLFKGHDDDGAE